MTPTLMTTEQLLALPDDGVRRWLIRGRLREHPERFRDRDSAVILTIVGAALFEWNRGQPEPRGDVLVGNAGVRLRRSPDTTLGADIAYVGPDVAARGDPAGLIDGPPVLVVEVLSPIHVLSHVAEKTDEYLAAGVRLVWVIDPHDRTVTGYRPAARPVMFNDEQELTADPELPGFRTPVRHLFP